MAPDISGSTEESAPRKRRQTKSSASAKKTCGVEESQQEATLQSSDENAPAASQERREFTSALLTRLLTEDTWPPAAWVRNKWVDYWNGNDWGELFVCPFCMAPWLAIPILGWGWLSDLHWSWWLFNGWLALAYVAAMIVARDIPNGE